MPHFYCRSWGVLNQDSLQLDGYALSKMDIETQALGLKNLKKIPFPLVSRVKFASNSWNPNIFILDMRLVCHLAFPKVDIKQFSFLLNNAPVEAKGQLT